MQAARVEEELACHLAQLQMTVATPSMDQPKFQVRGTNTVQRYVTQSGRAINAPNHMKDYVRPEA